MKSLYIHVPFCKAKCGYCDFVSYPEGLDLIDKYLIALEREMQLYRGMKLSTIFIGGGTPSLLSVTQLDKLIKLIKNNFDLTSLLEFTLEANPESLTLEKIAKLNIVNRFSLGLQAFDNNILKKIGRLHTFERFQQVFAYLSDCQKDINIDLIVGFKDYPYFLRELNMFLKNEGHKITHLSLYMLDNYSTAEDQVETYLESVRIIKNYGFLHYEISNFAKKGKECKHNLVYWNRGEYLGLGPSACSFLKERRYKNANKLADYFNGKQEVEELSNEQVELEKKMLNMRLLDKGIPYQKKYDFWIQKGYLKTKVKNVVLTDLGIPFFNQIFLEL
ncbi:MAG: coproporphyrinogen III oxidase family protein [bacterium]|nr:coproporphyrinogen III oxidase family protein [bacterium]